MTLAFSLPRKSHSLPPKDECMLCVYLYATTECHCKWDTHTNIERERERSRVPVYWEGGSVFTPPQQPARGHNIVLGDGSGETNVETQMPRTNTWQARAKPQSAVKN